MLGKPANDARSAVAGCELSQAWASLGSAVIVREMADRLLPTYEPIAGRLLAQAMTAAGIDVRLRMAAGATFVGLDAGELLHAATMAVVGEVPLDRLWHGVPSYPAISEVWLRLLETDGL